MSTVAADAREYGSSLPVSAFPPILLRRPLELFGQMEIHVSSPVTFSPATVFEAVFGTSMQAVMRDKTGREGARFYQLSKALWDVCRGKRRLTTYLRNLAFALLGQFIPRDRIERDLAGHRDGSAQSDWRTVGQGMAAREDVDDWLRRSVSFLAETDDLAFAYRAMVRRGETAAVESLLRAAYGERLWEWQTFCPELQLALVLPVETTLEALSVADAFAVRETGRPTSYVLPLLESSEERPLTKWFQLLRAAAPGHPTLEVLSSRTLVPASTLKHWSSSKERLMPEDRLDQVLKAVLLEDRRAELKAQFFAARLITFLCEVISSEGPSRSWPEVQTHVRVQYEHLFIASQQS